ncbi:MAG: endolytic transglycosylase MltG [Clostridia bacterium]
MDKDKIDTFELNIDEEILNKTAPIDDIRIMDSKNQVRRQANESKVQDYYKDKDKKQYKKEHKKRNKVKAVKNRRVFRLVWAAMVIIVGLSLASYLITGSNDLFAVNRTSGTTDVEVPEEIDVSTMAQLLYEAGAIDAPEFFTIYCTLTTSASTFVSGVHELSTDMDYEYIISELQSYPDKEVVEDVLFREGLTAIEIAAVLEENSVCSAEEFLEALNDEYFDAYDMISEIDNEEDKYYTVEGYLFPDKYDFYVGESVNSVIGKMLYNFQTKFTSQMLEQVEESGYTLDEIIIIASIIQAEAADEADMYKVSAVIHNRLESGASVSIYSLGLDSTIYYPYSSLEEVPDGFTSDYNTYNISGLPAGAICNPGTDAINAALNPDEDYSEMYYFCHDEDGNGYYAETAAGHAENLKKYITG